MKLIPCTVCKGIKLLMSMYQKCSIIKIITTPIKLLYAFTTKNENKGKQGSELSLLLKKVIATPKPKEN